MSTTPNLNQVHYRVRTDTGLVNDTPTWAAAEDTSVSLAVETTFRIRFCFQNTGTAAAVSPMVLRVSKNGGAYTALTTSSGATLGAQSADAGTSTDDTIFSSANFRLTAGTGSATSGLYDETGSAAAGITNGFYTEFEYGLILKTAGAVPGDTFDFRIYNNTTAFTTYSQTPRVIARQTGTNFNQTTDASQLIGFYADYNAAGRSSATVPISTPYPGSAAGNLVLVYYATDNATTNNADEGVVTSVTDTKGNTYSKARDWQFGSPGVQAGTCVGLWYSNSTAALVAGTDSVTLNLSSSGDRDAIAIIVNNVLMTAGKAAAVEATNTSASTISAAVLPSLNATTGNIECLRVRIASGERNAAYSISLNRTSGWSYMGEIAANSGSSATSQAVSAEMRIFTGTGAASAPTGTFTGDQASVYVAFRADTAGPPNDACLANDVSSASSVQTGANLQQVHGILANDVASPSSVSQPAAVIRRDALANDVTSASSVSTPTAVHVVPPVACLANDVLSASNVTQPTQFQQRHSVLANDVLSASSVTQPIQLRQLQGLLANDVISTSKVTNPNAVIGRAALANDVLSGSSVSIPTATQIVGSTACLANDVVSASSVTQPAAVIRRDALANDIKSNSTVTQPAAIIGRTLLANDVVSPSSVSQPVAVIQRAILANDVTSPSKVSNPVAGTPGIVDARDITSASSVSNPALKSLQGLLANDVVSPSSVTKPVALIQRNALANDVLSPSSVSKPIAVIQRGLLANDVLSPSSVSKPAAGQIVAGQPLANDIVSQSSVSRPTLAIVGAPPVTVPSPVPPAHGGGAGGYIGAKAKEHLAELIEIAYRKALKIKEPEVVEAIRAAVKEAIPERQAQRLRTEDFNRLAADLSVVKGLLAEIKQAAKEVEIQSAIDALIEYELALEEDDMEVLLIAA